MEEAQLITPLGERIVLPAHIYARVMEMLAVDKPPLPMTNDEIEAVIRETRGSLSGKTSMTEALLRSRREERARERKPERGSRKAATRRAPSPTWPLCTRPERPP